MHSGNAFELELTVGEGDIDILNHASNVAYVRWIQDVALAHSASKGLDFDAYSRLGGVFIVVRHEIDYLRPALRGDLMLARTWVPTAMSAKCERATEILRKRDGEILARGKTVWGYVDLVSGRPRRIPNEVRVAFSWPGAEITENRVGD